MEPLLPTPNPQRAINTGCPHSSVSGDCGAWTATCPWAPNATKPLWLQSRLGGFNLHPNCSQDWVVHWKFLRRHNLDLKVFCVRSFKLLRNASISLPTSQKRQENDPSFDEIFLRAHCACEDEEILSSPLIGALAVRGQWAPLPPSFITSSFH